MKKQLYLPFDNVLDLITKVKTIEENFKKRNDEFQDVLSDRGIRYSSYTNGTIAIDIDSLSDADYVFVREYAIRPQEQYFKSLGVIELPLEEAENL